MAKMTCCTKDSDIPDVKFVEWCLSLKKKLFILILSWCNVTPNDKCLIVYNLLFEYIKTSCTN